MNVCLLINQAQLAARLFTLNSQAVKYRIVCHPASSCFVICFMSICYISKVYDDNAYSFHKLVKHNRNKRNDMILLHNIYEYKR